MSAGNYDGARVRFMAALDIQPDNRYVKQKLSHLDSLSQASSHLARGGAEPFRRLSAEGDSLLSLLGKLGKEDRLLADQIKASARESYLRALVYRPEDQAIRAKLTQLIEDPHSMLPGATEGADRERLRAQQAEQYRRAIEQGDRLLAAGNYLEAQIRFKEALTYQANDPYAAQRLEMIDARASEVSRTERYEAYRKRGDEFFRGKLYDQAIMAYREALAVKPGDQGLIARIAECDSLDREAKVQVVQSQERAQQAQAAQQYQQTIADGDALVARGEYEAAIAHFRSAVQRYPNDPLLASKLKNVIDVSGKVLRTNANGVYTVLHESERPKLIGTMKDLHARIRYPDAALKAGVEGRVYVEFVVDEQGRVQSPRVVRGLSPACDQAALRVIKGARFQPAIVDGSPVKALQILYFTFKLPE